MKKSVKFIYTINALVFIAGYLFFITGEIFRTAQKVFNVKSIPNFINNIYYSDNFTAPFLIISALMIICAVAGSFAVKKYVSKTAFVMLLLDYIPIALNLFIPVDLSGDTAQAVRYCLSAIFLIAYFVILLIFYFKPIADFE